MGLHFKCSLGEWSSPRALSNFCCFTSSQRPYKFGGTTFWAKIEAKDNFCVKMSCLLKHIVGLSFTVASWENESMPCGLVSCCFPLLFLLSRLWMSACCRESATVCPLAGQVTKLLAILSPWQKSGATITGISASECPALCVNLHSRLRTCASAPQLIYWRLTRPTFLPRKCRPWRMFMQKALALAASSRAPAFATVDHTLMSKKKKPAARTHDWIKEAAVGGLIRCYHLSSLIKHICACT